MSKTRVAVIRGGPSDEYDVSLRTGSAVLQSLDTNSFEPLDVVITQAGEWLQDGRIRYPEFLIPTFDVVFIALHGTYGEDGTIQRLLDRFGVPYTGSGAYASGIAMHKGLTKEHVGNISVRLPKHVLVSRHPRKSGSSHAATIWDQFGPQYVVKPVNSGSSVGVQVVLSPHDLPRAIDVVFDTHESIIVEEYIAGKEVTCGVIERFRDHEVYALPPILIVPPKSSTFFDYSVKYNGATQEICPAPISPSDTRAIEHAAKEIHTKLNLSQYSRSDFILSPQGLYFLEVNTLPGLTKESLVPKALEAVGASHSTLVNHLVHDALSLRRTRVVPYIHI